VRKGNAELLAKAEPGDWRRSAPTAAYDRIHAKYLGLAATPGAAAAAAPASAASK
jgi:hypothetical protein